MCVRWSEQLPRRIPCFGRRFPCVSWLTLASDSVEKNEFLMSLDETLTMLI